jgi:hypothetical protein
MSLLFQSPWDYVEIPDADDEREGNVDQIQSRGYRGGEGNAGHVASNGRVSICDLRRPRGGIEEKKGTL